MPETETPTQVQDAPTGDLRGAAEAPEAPEATVTAQPEAEDVVEGKEKESKTWADYEATEGFSDLANTQKEAWLTEARPDIERDAKSAAMREFDPHMQRQTASLDQVATSAQELANAGQSALQKIRSAVRAGTLDANALEDFATDNPVFARFLNGSLLNVNTLTNAGMDKALEILAKESGNSNLKEDMYLRLRNDPAMSNSDFAKEYLDKLTEARSGTRISEAVEKAVKPKDAEIARLTAENNKYKSKLNAGEGPPDMPGSPAGGRPTPEQWASMSTVDRNKARAEGRGPTD